MPLPSDGSKETRPACATIKPHGQRKCQLERGRPVRSSSVKHQAARDLFSLIGVALLVSLVAVQKELDCLRISSIRIPPAIANGSQTTLECNYELGPGEQLYSVTWYKDRVGFYRYQPAAEAAETTPAPPTISLEQAGQNLNSNYQSHQRAAEPSAAQAPASARNEPDWLSAGISLDLSRSNSTHVHLKQVALSGEGTFECEVIADAPTFATVSASRQMKVHVLSKRKLFLADNPQQSLAQSQNEQAAQNWPRQNLYQLNDLLNATCTSGPSKPAARLSWFLNDQPIAAFLAPPNSTAQADNHKLTSGPRARPVSQATSFDSLAETSSTLLLRLQEAHLRQLKTRPGQQARQRSAGAYLSLKLSCVAQLRVEFSSNTSLLISGGKTGTTKRSRNQPDAPEASSLRLEQGATVNVRRRLEPHDSAREEGQDGAEEPCAETVPEKTFRWQPTSTGQAAARFRPKPAPADYEPEASQWDGELSGHARQGKNLVVWTERQLRDQSEFVERLMARSEANALEPAHIEAQTMVSGRRAGEQPGDDQSPQADWSPPNQNDNDNDFELYELVNFTCHQDDQAQDGQSRLHSVHLKWFLNDRELTGDLVNAFEPSRGFYFEPNDTMTREREPGVDLQPKPATPDGDCAPATPRPTRTRSLMIEFSPSLFRLKELTLKCKTVVEQPLIEFESVQWLYLASSPFIQAQEHHQPPSRPSLFATNTKHRQKQRQPPSGRRQQQDGNVVRMRHQPGRASASSSAPDLLGKSLGLAQRGLCLLATLFATIRLLNHLGGPPA